MGYGNYSQDAHAALLNARSNKPVKEVFNQSQCHPLMNPKGVKLRESRDADNHPNSMGIVFALDVTGSMGAIPRLMATQQLPVFMKVLMDCKIQDPQLLFMAVGDAYSDQAALQVGQFESTAELMDQWLTWSYLEGGGGGQGMETYELAMYFLATHTEMDCMVKRNKKGYVFITGDEKHYPVLSKQVVEAVIGDRLDDDLTVEEVVAELQKSFVPFFIIPSYESAKYIERTWRDLLGDHVITLESNVDVCYVTAGAILINEGQYNSLEQVLDQLTAAGMPPTRRSEVARSLTAFANVIFGKR